jgi:hypothetical protein
VSEYPVLTAVVHSVSFVWWQVSFWCAREEARHRLYLVVKTGYGHHLVSFERLKIDHLINAEHATFEKKKELESSLPRHIIHKSCFTIQNNAP